MSNKPVKGTSFLCLLKHTVKINKMGTIPCRYVPESDFQADAESGSLNESSTAAVTIHNVNGRVNRVQPL